MTEAEYMATLCSARLGVASAEQIINAAEYVRAEIGALEKIAQAAPQGTIAGASARAWVRHDTAKYNREMMLLNAAKKGKLQ